jgi:beta-exotoxin I transport system ATP-binding protein
VTATPPPITCRALTKYYGTTPGIEDLDLTVEGGSVTGFLGPNGAGKTTVIRVLTGTLRPTRGDAQLFGIDVRRPEARLRLGFMPADPAFYPGLSGRQNLDLLADLQRAAVPDREWAADVLGLAAPDLDRAVGDYSSGMIQKLGLIQAVQHRPDLVILDEPANRLDPIAHHRFLDLVREIAGQRRTVFLSSHSLAEVEAICHRVAMVRDARLLMTASVDELSAGALRRVTVRLRAPLRSVPGGLRHVEQDDGVLTGRVAGHRPEVLRALLDDPGVDDLLVEPASLEETFLHLYQGTDE